MRIFSAFLIAFVLSACKFEHVFFAGHGPDVDLFLEYPLSEVEHRFYKLDAPLECFYTQKERMTAAINAVDTIQAFSDRDFSESFFFVWDIQQCEREDDFHGGITRITKIYSGYLARRISYIGWPRGVATVAARIKVIVHEWWHQLRAPHCGKDYNKGYCIPEKEKIK